MNPSLDLNNMLLKLESDFLSGRAKTPFNRSNHIVTCWRLHNCTTKRCPSYGKEHVRCWQQSGTFCRPQKVMPTIKNKFANCLECPVFLKSTRRKELRVLEALNNLVYLVNGFESSSLSTNRMIMQNHERIKDKYELTVREFSILPMILAGEKRADIARELGVSENTLKTHVRHLFGKTKVRSVTDLRAKLASFVGVRK
jgi:DNA-binding CsgD family transcriptional regulator